MRLTLLRAALFCLGVAMGAAFAAPLSITNTQPLSFGTVVRGSGKVIVSPDGLRTSNGPYLVPSRPGSAAQFTVSGNPGNTYSVTLPASITLNNGSSTMTVNAFTSVPSTASRAGLLGAGGTQTLSVGATLAVKANQAAGVYSGFFTVTVNNP